MTMDENENKQLISKKPGLEKNLTVPMLVVVMLTGLAVWLVPDDEEEIDLKKPLPQLDSVIQPIDSEDNALPPLESVSAIRPLEEIESDGAEDTSKDEGSPESVSTIRPLEEIESDGAEDTSKYEGSPESESSTKPQENTPTDQPVRQKDVDVRVMISELRNAGSDAGQKAYDEAEKRRRAGDNENAYLLYFFAARNGHGDSALVLGTMADPIYHTSFTSALIAPDPAQAIKWYKKAIDAGNDSAKKNLADLTKHLKTQAENGSSEAQRLLLQLR